MSQSTNMRCRAPIRAAFQSARMNRKVVRATVARAEKRDLARTLSGTLLAATTAAVLTATPASAAFNLSSFLDNAKSQLSKSIPVPTPPPTPSMAVAPKASNAEKPTALAADAAKATAQELQQITQTEPALEPEAVADAGKATLGALPDMPSPKDASPSFGEATQGAIENVKGVLSQPADTFGGGKSSASPEAQAGAPSATGATAVPGGGSGARTSPAEMESGAQSRGDRAEKEVLAQEADAPNASAKKGEYDLGGEKILQGAADDVFTASDASTDADNASKSTGPQEPRGVLGLGRDVIGSPDKLSSNERASEKVPEAYGGDKPSIVDEAAPSKAADALGSAAQGIADAVQGKTQAAEGPPAPLAMPTSFNEAGKSVVEGVKGLFSQPADTFGDSKSSASQEAQSGKPSSTGATAVPGGGSGARTSLNEMESGAQSAGDAVEKEVAAEEADAPNASAKKGDYDLGGEKILEGASKDVFTATDASTDADTGAPKSSGTQEPRGVLGLTSGKQDATGTVVAEAGVDAAPAPSPLADIAEQQADSVADRAAEAIARAAPDEGAMPAKAGEMLDKAAGEVQAAVDSGVSAGADAGSAGLGDVVRSAAKGVASLSNAEVREKTGNGMLAE